MHRPDALHEPEPTFDAGEARYKSIAELSTDVVYRLTCSPLQFDYLSPSVTVLLGRTPEEFYESPVLLARVVHPDDLTAVLDGLDPEQRHPRVRLRLYHRLGHVVHAEAVGRPLLDADGTKVGVQGAIRDITAQHHLEQQLERMALQDPLTSLANRRHLLQSLTRRLDGGRPTAVVFVDLDGFKAVNDLYGHHAGDQVLTTVADRLRAATRDDDVVARLAGDEFVLVCHPAHAGRLARQLRAEVAGAIGLDGGGRVHLTASIGLAVADPVDTPLSVLARSDGAMYTEKRTRAWREQHARN